jgi:hypothetical protein
MPSVVPFGLTVMFISTTPERCFLVAASNAGEIKNGKRLPATAGESAHKWLPQGIPKWMRPRPKESKCSIDMDKCAGGRITPAGVVSAFPSAFTSLFGVLPYCMAKYWRGGSGCRDAGADM